jgi:hypothetical protein
MTGVVGGELGGCVVGVGWGDGCDAGAVGDWVAGGVVVGVRLTGGAVVGGRAGEDGGLAAPVLRGPGVADGVMGARPGVALGTPPPPDPSPAIWSASSGVRQPPWPRTGPG